MARKPTTLKGFRRAKGLTQRAAAALVSISQVEWCRLERGVRRPRVKLAQKIARKTGIPVTRLLGLR